MCALLWKKKQTRERNTTISGLLLRAEGQTSAVSFKLNENEKYSLKDLLNIQGKDSVTSGQCIWVKKTLSKD